MPLMEENKIVQQEEDAISLIKSHDNNSQIIHDEGTPDSKMRNSQNVLNMNPHEVDNQFETMTHPS